MNATILSILATNLLLIGAVAWLLQDLAQRKRARLEEKALTVLINNIRNRGKERDLTLRAWLGERLKVPGGAVPGSVAAILEAEKSLYKALILVIRGRSPQSIARLYQDVEGIIDSLYQLPVEESTQSPQNIEVEFSAPGDEDDAEQGPEPLSDLQHSAIDELFNALDPGTEASNEAAAAEVPADDLPQQDLPTNSETFNLEADRAPPKTAAS